MKLNLICAFCRHHEIEILNHRESLCILKTKDKNVDMQKKYFNRQQYYIDIPVITIE